MSSSHMSRRSIVGAGALGLAALAGFRPQVQPSAAEVASPTAAQGVATDVTELATLCMDSFPSKLQARLEVWDRYFASRLPGPDLFDSSVIEKAQLWAPGKQLRVAFRGGTPTLHAEIADAAKTWLPHGNIALDFGIDSATGTFRSWSPDDTQYRAEIRISFDQPGYWSVVGNDSINRFIRLPGEASMNLAGFDMVGIPPNGHATIIHEFGHALGFKHEHQSPKGGCESEFRFEDDPGYVPIPDDRGRFLPDSAGRRPGLYTYLAGYPNFWTAEMVDHNLRQLRGRESAAPWILSSFDRLSIMMYSFSADFFRSGAASHCFTPPNTTLSEQDKRGLAVAYPAADAAVAATLTERRALFDAIVQTDDPVTAAEIGIPFAALEP